jgi:hypothetical protein
MLDTLGDCVKAEIKRTDTDAVKHILSGLLRCECGASFEALKGGKGGHVYYCCSAARRKGPSVCRSDVRLPAALIEGSILNDVETKLLTANVMEPALDAVLERLSAHRPERSTLESERAKLARELSNLAAAVAAGVDGFTLRRLRAEAVAYNDPYEAQRPAAFGPELLNTLQAKCEAGDLERPCMAPYLYLRAHNKTRSISRA